MFLKCEVTWWGSTNTSTLAGVLVCVCVGGDGGQWPISHTSEGGWLLLLVNRSIGKQEGVSKVLPSEVSLHPLNI